LNPRKTKRNIKLTTTQFLVLSIVVRTGIEPATVVSVMSVVPFRLTELESVYLSTT
jgi:hypothetical protein